LHCAGARDPTGLVVTLAQSGFELWGSARVGYRFDFTVYGRELFVLAQPSIGLGVARQNRWPKMPSGHHPIFEPQLIVGTRF
jgi:hypothetical protein